MNHLTGRHFMVTAMQIRMFLLALSVYTGACDRDKPSERQGSAEPSMNPHDPSAYDLLDIVPRYFARVRYEDLKDPDIFKRLRATTPEYKAWMAKRAEAWDKVAEWGVMIDELRPQLLGYKLRNEAMPSMSSFEAAAWRNDDPKPADGVIYTSLVVRLSFFAPVYEIYESSARIVFAKPDDERWQYRDHRRTHDISPAFQPAAEAFARAIEARYGYQRVGPDVLDIQLLNVAMWEDGWYTGTLREALFSSYRL